MRRPLYSLVGRNAKARSWGVVEVQLASMLECGTDGVHASARTEKIDSRDELFLFQFLAPPREKRRSGSCRARASAFLYEARASGIRPNLRHSRTEKTGERSGCPRVSPRMRRTGHPLCW